MPKPTVCVFGGSAEGASPRYVEMAHALGAFAASEGWRVVYGAGSVGVMGALAKGVSEHDGELIGIVPQELDRPDIAFDAGQKVVVLDMHERKRQMFELADGFVALPGGLGTLDEIVEVLTYNQLGMLGKPIALLDVAGFWSGFVALVDHFVEQRFAHASHAKAFRVVHTARAAFEVVSEGHKWHDVRWWGDSLKPDQSSK